MNYKRVLPRDLFNEAKLLKSVGRLCLLIHDNLAPKGLSFKFDGESFKIKQLESGEITISNLIFSINNNEDIIFKTACNSRSNYPLIFEIQLDEFDVFNDDGTFDNDFLTKINSL
ncbi:hypothetical protein [Tenacibaculum finnmarkense]|uniref:hypothetical protein n=1 Tax=Tenacibaculum finnmarkense TaxID=2781243 RepID=UPI001EFACE9A|nr:hypothetical protein [Tenacibaculum finnmarkense]MCG8226403.1 hypothetical protein [Tenacibaculum finnmarkense genomovar finnmarkense]